MGDLIEPFTGVLPDALEAVLGAVLADGGLEAAWNVAHTQLEESVRMLKSGNNQVEVRVYRQLAVLLPRASLFVLKQSIPDKKFQCTLKICDTILATGQGLSKRYAPIWVTTHGVTSYI